MAATHTRPGNDRSPKKRGTRPSSRKPAAGKAKTFAAQGTLGGRRASKGPQARPRQRLATLTGGFIGTDVDFLDGRLVLKNEDLLQELGSFFGETEATHSALIRLSLSAGVEQPDNGATVDARC